MELDCHIMLYNIPKKDEQDRHNFEIEVLNDEYFRKKTRKEARHAFMYLVLSTV